MVKGMIYAIIPTYNRKDMLRNCLNCLKMQDYRKFKAIVIDDGSKDGTSEMLKKEFKKVDVIKGDGNLWWAGAINEGIKKVLKICGNDDYVLLLNDDLIFGKDYMDKLIESAKRFPNALIGSVVICKDKNIIFDGGMRRNWTAPKWVMNFGKPLSAFPKRHYENVNTLTGRGVLIPINVFQKIGLYDTIHFKQGGDIEFPARARLHGYNLVVCYNLIVRCNSDATFATNDKKIYKLNQLKDYFFHIKSNYNIKYRFWYAYKTSRTLFHAITYFIWDMARTSLNFLRKLRF